MDDQTDRNDEPAERNEPARRTNWGARLFGRYSMRSWMQWTFSLLLLWIIWDLTAAVIAKPATESVPEWVALLIGAAIGSLTTIATIVARGLFGRDEDEPHKES